MEERSIQWRKNFITVSTVYSLGMVSPSKSQQQQQQRRRQNEQEHEQPSRVNNKWDKPSHIRIQRGPKPLEKKSFYLDIKNHTTAAKIEARIKDLGGSIEVFLVRGVSLVASDRADRTRCANSEKRKWGFTSGGSGGFPSLRSIEVPTPTQTPPTPFFSSECPLSNSTNLRGSAAQRSKSRVDAMLERALIQPQQYSVDPLDNAQTWGIPIWAVEKLQAWLDKISASIKDNERFQCTTHSDKTISSKDIKIRHLKGPFLKFESYHRNTRPVFCELTAWPKLNLYGEPGFCPFDTKKREPFECYRQTTKRDVKENRREVLDLANRGQKDMTRRQRTATARARRTEHLASGYCEICRTEYRDLSKHVQSDQHLSFVRNDDNFLSLDRLIDAGANVEAFLKLNHSKSIERDCGVFPEDEHGLDGVVAESNGVRNSKSLESFAITDEIKMVQCNGSRRNVESKFKAQPHNLRTRLKHESGHLLRSKGSPWHELEKSDKFYDKFEGFTVKKRAKGTIWIEEENHSDTDAFLQGDSRNEFSKLKQNAYAVAHLAQKCETTSEKVVNLEVYEKKKNAVSPAKSIVRLGEQQQAAIANNTSCNKQDSEIENGKVNARVNGIITIEGGGGGGAAAVAAVAGEIRGNEPLNQFLYECPRSKNYKSLTPEESLVLAVTTTDKLSRVQTEESPRQISLTNGLLCNGNSNEKPPVNGEVLAQEKERVDKDKNGHSEERGQCANAQCAEKNKEKQQVQRNSGKSAKWNRRGGRNGTRARHRLSVEERLIEDNRAYYRVEVLGSKLRSSVVPSGGSSTVTCSLSKDVVSEEQKKEEEAKEVKEEVEEAPSSEKPVVVRFKRVRKSELSLLSDEAESFMFGEQKRDNSSESSEDDQSSVLPQETEDSVREGSRSSALPSSSSLSDSGAIVENCAAVVAHPARTVISSCLGSSTPVKSEAGVIEEDSQDSLGSLGRARKRRRTQAEALIRDNTDYYKFETPGSRLRYQGSLADVRCREQDIISSSGCELLGNPGEAVTKLSREGRPTNEAFADQPEKIYPSKPSAEVEKLQFSFEAVPCSEPWYQTYQRQDQGAEYWHYFSESDIRKPFLLPYEIENFHEVLSKFQSRVDAKRKGRGRSIGCIARSPRKSPRCHASTLAIMSTIIRKKEQQLQQQQQHTLQPMPSLYTIDEQESVGSPTDDDSTTPMEKDAQVKLETIGELKAIARTIDEMLDVKDCSDFLDPLGIDVDSAYTTDTNLYGASTQKGPPPNLLELLDNCHEIVNCLENSSCASSECGEGNPELPLKRRKKRKNRTGWPGIKLKRKLQNNKSTSEIECDLENQSDKDKTVKSVQCNSNNGARETIRTSVKMLACDFSPTFSHRSLSSSSRNFSFAQIFGMPLKTENRTQQLIQDVAVGVPSETRTLTKLQKGVTLGETKNENQFDMGLRFPGTSVAAAPALPRCDDNCESGGCSESTEHKLPSTEVSGGTLDNCGELPGSSVCLRSGNLGTEMQIAVEGPWQVSQDGGGPLTERDATASKDFNVHRNGTDIKPMDVSEYELGNDENHENLQRRPASKVSMRKRHRDNTSSTDVHEICHELEKHESNHHDHEQGVCAGGLPNQESEIERHTNTVYKRNNRVATKRRRFHSVKRRARKDNIRCPSDTVFESENCKKDSYLSISCRKQHHMNAKSPKEHSEADAAAGAGQEGEIDIPLSERISTRLVSSSELEQRRSSIDFQPVVRMMKIDEQVDVDHGILSVTVASNRRLRSSSSPRSSNPPPKKRLKSSVNRGQFGRLLKGS